MTAIFAGVIYSNEILFQGFIDGLIYALIAIGLVLIYKATGVINFAQGAIGTFGGFVMGMLMVNYDLLTGLLLFLRSQQQLLYLQSLNYW